MTYFTDSEELRQLGRLFGITDPNAGCEAIGDEITSRFETLAYALRKCREYVTSGYAFGVYPDDVKADLSLIDSALDQARLKAAQRDLDAKGNG